MLGINRSISAQVTRTASSLITHQNRQALHTLQSSLIKPPASVQKNQRASYYTPSISTLSIQSPIAGKIAYLDTDPLDHVRPALVFIHGNSACKEIFNAQLSDQSLRYPFRLIAVDLPGHGKSEKALNPERTYSFSGYAEAIGDFIQSLSLKKVIVMGHSLGGHIAIELLSHEKVTGIVISGAPTINFPQDMAKGFQVRPEYFRPGAEKFTPALMGSEAMFDEKTAHLFHLAGDVDMSQHGYLIKAGMEASGLARSLMFQKIISDAPQHDTLVRKTFKPVIAIHGKNDAIINGEVIQLSLQKANHPDNKQFIEMEGVGHGCMLSKPEQFNGLLLGALSKQGLTPLKGYQA